MVFSSVVFLVWFLPLSLIIYYLLPFKYKNYFLLAISLVFYAWGAPKFTLVLSISVIIDFYLVKMMVTSKSMHYKRLILTISVLISLLFLLYFKYANFFIENLNLALVSAHSDKIINWPKVILPIGISFFTFQKITYSIDIYRGNTQPAQNAAFYLLYVVMYPQLIAGPIVRYNSVAKQLNARTHFMSDRINGFIRFGIGLAKKVLIANVLGEYADAFFNHSFIDRNTGEAWIALLSYAFQIYYDFAGYSDMAIGLGRMFGFTFPENFDSPYTSKSITEFWRRWHITLGHWMRDYLYIPLGGNRVNNKLRLYFNLWLVFLISGLWHGASWNFVIWGAYHGLFLALERLFLIKLLKKAGIGFSWLFTFFLVINGWVFFRVESFSESLHFFKLLYGGISLPTVNNSPFGFWLIFVVAVFFSFSSSIRAGKNLEIIFHRGSKQLTVTVISLAVVIVLYILSLSQIVSSNYNPFIYFRF
ncbi:MAG: MBOAT family protein [Bacteroidota bacterium]|nr:MAG: MBOAT family protein [Bacteroidota bacterium]